MMLDGDMMLDRDRGWRFDDARFRPDRRDGSKLGRSVTDASDGFIHNRMMMEDARFS